MSARMWAMADQLASVDVRHADGRIKRRVFVPLYVLRVLIQVGRTWVRDRCPQKAAALAFQTALSLVPLIAVALALLRAFGAFDAESTLVEWLSKQVLPVSASTISTHLVDWAHNVTSGSLGVVGIVVVVILGFITASSVERMWNDVWKVERRRSIGQRFVVFYALITIVPALVGISLFHLARVGLTQGVIGGLGALAATWAALVFANKLLPACHVTWRAALVGGLVSAVFFELAKYLFSIYVAEIAFKKYAGMYGAIGLIPILLVWIYYTWVVILFGAEIAYAVQHLSELELFDRRSGRLETEVLDRVNGLVAARCMVVIVEAWKQGKPLTREAIGRKLHLAPETSERIVRRLRDKKLILELEGEPPAFMPGRAPAEITLADVFSPFRGADVMTPGVRAASRDRVDQALARIEGERTASLAAITLESLTKDHVTPDFDPDLETPIPKA